MNHKCWGAKQSTGIIIAVGGKQMKLERAGSSLKVRINGAPLETESGSRSPIVIRIANHDDKPIVRVTLARDRLRIQSKETGGLCRSATGAECYSCP